MPILNIDMIFKEDELQLKSQDTQLKEGFGSDRDSLISKSPIPQVSIEKKSPIKSVPVEQNALANFE